MEKKKKGEKGRTLVPALVQLNTVCAFFFRFEETSVKVTFKTSLRP